jgi:GGDEF domain-containing protein
VKRWMLLARRFFLLGAWFLSVSIAQAAPQINWGEMLAQSQGKEKRESLEIDLRQRWERTLVGSIQEPDSQPIDPASIWAWPAQRFSSVPNLKPVPLRKGERLITRMTVFSERLASDFSITVMMPRLDVAHVSYRYDNGPWKTLSAGDRIPMNKWSLADREPSFNLPLPPGQLDVVMQFVHRGILDAPVLLQNNRAFLESRTASIGVTGLFVGVNLVMALMGVLMALNFHKTGFLAVTAMNFIMALVLVSSSGLAGMFVQTSSDEFNDLSKFIINTTWGALLPLVAAIALGIHVHSRRLWWLSMLIFVAVSIAAVVLADYEQRDSTPMTVGVMMALIMIFVLSLLAWAWFKNYSQNWGVTVGLLLYPLCLFSLFAAYSGFISTDLSGKLASMLCTLASVALIRGLFLQHRMGRQVLARANTSPLRDVLTGLLNRDGMQAHLYKSRERMREEQICALFIYMPVLDANTAMEELGEQGFESGMVQIAASLTTSVSATDGVARISRHAFGISVLMQPDSATATRLAQKILTRVMALAASGTPLCATARLGMAWLPLNSFRIDGLEQRCLEALETLETGKRIAWVGGAQSYKEAEQMMRAMSTNPSDPPVVPAANAYASTTGAESNLYDRIHRIEREMLGVDTRFLEEEADRMSRALNEARDAQERDKAALAAQGKPDDFEPTVQQLAPQKPWPG